MPLDGIVINSVCSELNNILKDSKIDKIFQPERDNVIINIRTRKESLKLLLSVNPNSPRIHLTETHPDNPQTPPIFCMLLRKHLYGGRIVNVSQHQFERIVELTIDTIDELGDRKTKKLIIEMMGKHSNIILVNDANIIIDSIKRINEEMSRARQVLPGMLYNYPPSHDKIPLNQIQLEPVFNNDSANTPIQSILLNNIMGFGPLICKELCLKSGVNPSIPLSQIPLEQKQNLKKEISTLVTNIEQGKFTPCLFQDNSNLPLDFYCFKIHFPKANVVSIDTMNKALDIFYTSKSRSEKLNSRKSELLKAVSSIMDKCNKRLEIHEKSIHNVSDHDRFRLYGELIYANIYNIKQGQSEVTVDNYYSDIDCVSACETNNAQRTLTIPLAQHLSPSDNAKLYFKKYNKAKSTLLAASEQREKTINELNYLEGINQSIQNCENETDLEEIRKELVEQAIISSRKHTLGKKDAPSVPMKYISSDGFIIFVGKNNKQNDSLTLRMARRNDIWLHTQKIPGSHVIIKTENRVISNVAISEAARLAAYYSKARSSTNVAVDYTEIKNVKKPAGAKPGMVIYTNFSTLFVSTNQQDIERLKRLD